MQTLQVTVTIRHDCPVVGVAGEVDMTTVAQLRAAIDRGMVPNEPLVLDLTRVAFLDASGLRTLLGASGDAVGAVHGEFFKATRPAATMVVVAGLLDARWKVEIEAEAEVSA